MKKEIDSLKTLSEIHSMMERSTRFISLNGLSGVFAGIFALMGAFSAYIFLKMDVSTYNYYDLAYLANGSLNPTFILFVFTDAFLVLFSSIAVAIFLSMRKAKKLGLKMWDNAAKRLLINLLIPLIVGGLFCLILIVHGWMGLVAPCTLIFYGLALINASKYTVNDIRYLGITQTVIGLFASIWIGYGLLFWAIGFGLFHIIYGTVMYFKYEV